MDGGVLHLLCLLLLGVTLHPHDTASVEPKFGTPCNNRSLIWPAFPSQANSRNWRGPVIMRKRRGTGEECLERTILSIPEATYKGLGIFLALLPSPVLERYLPRSVAGQQWGKSHRCTPPRERRMKERNKPAIALPRTQRGTELTSNKPKK